MHAHKEALTIIKKLDEKGYIAYFAGGWVRDYLLKRESDDIDIATNAPTDEIQKIFPHTVPIGLAFGIILVIINDKQFEVATFRKDLEYKDGRHPSGVAFSTAAEDAKRRDFTINGMFYDPLNDEILDFVGGQEDLKRKLIKAIGNPEQRILEDRLRMIRAIRFSVCLNFVIELKTQEAILKHAKDLFPSVAIERVWQELTKISDAKALKKGLIELFKFNLLQEIFPSLKNTSLDLIEKRLSPINSFPPNTPLIAKILKLFEDFSIDERIELCKYLKLSNGETDFMIRLEKAKVLIQGSFQNNLQPWQSAHLYADPSADIFLNIIAADFTKDKQSEFLQAHQIRKKSLVKQISRITEQNPVLKSSHLKKEGIPPSKTMGTLLKEGEKIAINRQMEDPYQIIEELKKSSFWPK